MGLDAFVFCDCVEKKRLKTRHPFSELPGTAGMCFLHACEPCHEGNVLGDMDAKRRHAESTCLRHPETSGTPCACLRHLTISKRPLIHIAAPPWDPTGMPFEPASMTPRPRSPS